MAARFVTVDHDTPLLLPPDLREWVPQGHWVHFILDAVGQLEVRAARVNERGTGDEQLSAGDDAGLLIYSYATGVFSSRAIERNTSDSVPVRVLCADTHPDHDTICTFRLQNGPLLRASFAQVLELAARCAVLKLGGITVAIDLDEGAGQREQARGGKPCARRGADARAGFGTERSEIACRRQPAGWRRRPPANRRAFAKGRAGRCDAARRRPEHPR